MTGFTYILATIIIYHCENGVQKVMGYENISVVNSTYPTISASVTWKHVVADNQDEGMPALDDTKGTSATYRAETVGKVPLYIGGIFSLGGVWEGSGVIPAVQMGLDHINARTDVLYGYELRMVWNDSQCNAGLGSRAFIDQLFHKPTKLLLLGPPCSTSAQAIAETSHYWNLVTFSYSAESPSLSNRDKFPLFCRSVPTIESLNPPIVALMKKYGWTRLATIQQNLDSFLLAIEHISQLLHEANFTMVASETIAEDARIAMANLKRRDAKIIFVSMYETHARKTFCEAYKRGMMRSGYVYIIYNWYYDGWWKEKNDDIDCSVEEMEEAMVSTTILTLSRRLQETKGDTTVSGWTPWELESQLHDRFTWPENAAYTLNTYGTFAYDATWAIALMLNKTVDVLKERVFSNGKKRRLEDFHYGDAEMARLFLDVLSEISFYGMSGHIAFQGGDRRGDSSILQTQGPAKHLIGYYRVHSSNLELVSDIKWKDGYIPIDHTATIRIYIGIGHLSFGVVSSFAGIGIVSAMCFLGFNLKFRKERTVKMSSPNMNNLIIIGSIFTYGSVIIGGFDRNIIPRETVERSCQLRAWLFSTGFVLTFGSMFTKTWRVYRISALKTPRKLRVTDNHLVMMVILFLCIDVVILTLWQVIDPMYIETVDVDEFNDPKLANQRVIHYIEQCTSESYLLWILPLYGYKGLLLIFGAFLAWETRKVTIPALNDSKLIGICVYNTVMLCAIGVAINFLTKDPSHSFIFLSSIVIFCTSVTLLVVFLPKVVAVIRSDEESEKPVGTIHTVRYKPPGSSDFSEDFQKLQSRIDELEGELKQRVLKENASVIIEYSRCGFWCGHLVCGCCKKNTTEAGVEGSGTEAAQGN